MNVLRPECELAPVKPSLPNHIGEDAQDGWKADLMKDSNFVAKSDEWLVLFLGSNVQSGTLRLFAYLGAFLAIGATLAYFVR